MAYVPCFRPHCAENHSYYTTKGLGPSWHCFIMLCKQDIKERFSTTSYQKHYHYFRRRSNPLDKQTDKSNTAVSGPQESTDKDTQYRQALKPPRVGPQKKARKASSPGGPQHLIPGSGDKRQTWVVEFVSGPGQNRKGTISSGSHSRTTQSSLPDSAVSQAVMSLCSPSRRGGAALSQVGQGDFPLINHRSGPSLQLHPGKRA